MARKRNPVGTARITISTTPVVREYLSLLVGTGLYGKTPPDAAERLVARGVEAALAAGVIRPFGK